MTKEEVGLFLLSLTVVVQQCDGMGDRPQRSTNGEAPTVQKSEIKTLGRISQASEDLERPPDIPYQAPTDWPSLLPSSPTQPRSVHERGPNAIP
jgi:hypothetical protein